MRISSAYGVIEIGHIYWSGPSWRASSALPRPQYLFQKYAFAELAGIAATSGNTTTRTSPAKRALTLRFGFKLRRAYSRSIWILQGRQSRYRVVHDHRQGSGLQLSKAYEAWLDPSNFDAAGHQKGRVEDFRKDFGAV